MASQRNDVESRIKYKQGAYSKAFLSSVCLILKPRENMSAIVSVRIYQIMTYLSNYARFVSLYPLQTLAGELITLTPTPWTILRTTLLLSGLKHIPIN